MSDDTDKPSLKRRTSSAPSAEQGSSLTRQLLTTATTQVMYDLYFIDPVTELKVVLKRGPVQDLGETMQNCFWTIS